MLFILQTACKESSGNTWYQDLEMYVMTRISIERWKPLQYHTHGFSRDLTRDIPQQIHCSYVPTSIAICDESSSGDTYMILSYLSRISPHRLHDINQRLSNALGTSTNNTVSRSNSKEVHVRRNALFIYTSGTLITALPALYTSGLFVEAQVHI